MGAIEVLTVGRVGVDLYAEQKGASLGEARTFAKSVGGSPTNVAVAAARLGCSSAVVTAVGEDDFGGYIRDALERFGVDTRFVGSHGSLRTPLAIAATDPPEDPTLVFYREPAAPDDEIALEERHLPRRARRRSCGSRARASLAVSPARRRSRCSRSAAGGGTA
jgi:5-dehydro-2-deoxygluconokinase